MKVYRITNNFSGEKIQGGSAIETANNPDFGNVGFVGSELGVSRQPQKFITLPLLTDFRNNGYQDLINKLAQEEKDKNVNTVIDRETIKYISANFGTQDPSGLTLKFIFFDKDQEIYGSDWGTAGFTQEEISGGRNALTKSFFKLDFYDSIDQNNSNYLFSEFLSVNRNQTTTFSFNRLYWLKNDPKFIEENTYRTLYFDVIFFNAKDGTTRRFINREISVFGGITLAAYRTNKQWRYANLRVLNPYTDVNNTDSNNNRIFYVEPINNNNDDEIIFSEIKLPV